jgi:hypothetical protein
LEWHPDIRHYQISCAWTDATQTLEFKLDGDKIPYHYTSPFIGTVIAWKYLQAKRIGILGMDLLRDHHMSNNRNIVNRGFGELRQELLKRGTEIVNLSPIADIDTLPLKPLSFIRKRS